MPAQEMGNTRHGLDWHLRDRTILQEITCKRLNFWHGRSAHNKTTEKRNGEVGEMNHEGWEKN